jgi:hypothetical protein
MSKIAASFTSKTVSQALLAGTLLFGSTVSALAASDPIPSKTQLLASPELCEMFHQNGDNSWSADRELTVMGNHGKITIQPSIEFVGGVPFHGVDLGRTLEDQCWEAQN